MQGGGGGSHLPLSRHVILKTDFSSVFLSTQFRVTNEPGMASSVEVSNTLITESITELRVKSMGGGSEHRGFSLHNKEEMIVESSFKTKILLPRHVTFG